MKEEIVHLIDVVTTNKTDFFREPKHFTYLVENALPELTSLNQGGRPLLVWSAGCSTGEEPYTLAIVLSEYGLTHPGFRFQDTGHRHLDHGAGQGGDGRLLRRDRGPGAAALQAQVLHAQPRTRLEQSPGSAGVAAAGRVSPAELHGLRLWRLREGRRDLLPQRHHLFRPAHAGADSRQALPPSGATGVSLRRPCRGAARHAFAA